MGAFAAMDSLRGCRRDTRRHFWVRSDYCSLRSPFCLVCWNLWTLNMVRIYTCAACELGDHKHCELGHSAPEGVFGGSKCICPCHGDPDYMKKAQVELRKHAEELLRFEEQSRKSMGRDKIHVRKPIEERLQ